MKYLSIIVPHYKETERELFPLLSSVQTQVGIDFNDIEVIIATDGGGVSLDKEFLSIFSFDIREIRLEKNEGPGVARQAGLENSKAQYVTFIDADDSLHNVGVLESMIQETEASAPDILYSHWIEQIRDDNTGVYTYLTHENENTWMFGKLIRRMFLVSNNISFHKDLRVHEDSYILAIAAALTDRKRVLPITSYIWKYQPNSITRINGGIYTYNSIPVFVNAVTMAHAEVERRGVDITEAIIQFICYNFFQLHAPGWQEENHKQYLVESEKELSKVLKPFMHYWIDNPQERVRIYNGERGRNPLGYIEYETIDAWLERLGLLQKTEVPQNKVNGKHKKK